MAKGELNNSIKKKIAEKEATKGRPFRRQWDTDIVT
jgi:hypothetical protein